MAQRDGAAIDIEPGHVQPQLSAHGQGLRTLRFVDLETANLVKDQAGARQQQPDRRRRANAHELRRHAHHSGGHHPRQGAQALCLGVSARCDHAGRGTVHQRRAVATSLHASGIDRPELGQHLGGRQAGVAVLCDLRQLAL